MSLMVNGELRGDWFEEEVEQGAFVRRDSVFRDWITADGSPGASGATAVSGPSLAATTFMCRTLVPGRIVRLCSGS